MPTTTPTPSWRRPLLLGLATLLLLYALLPRLAALWLPALLAPYGFEDLNLALRPPGPRTGGVDSLGFVWNGPDGLRLRFRTGAAEYRYADDALLAEDAELELLAWPVSAAASEPVQPLAAWPLMPMRSLAVERLRLTFPVDGKKRSTLGRLAANLDAEGTAKLVLYVTEGLPDGLPGRFELRIAPGGELLASAGLSRGKTTSFYAETRLTEPPAQGPEFAARIAGDLRPFYRWLEREVPEDAKIRAQIAGRLPTSYALAGWLSGLNAHGDFALNAKNWRLPQGLAREFNARGRLDYERGQGAAELSAEKMDALGVRLPALRLSSYFEPGADRLSARGELTSAPLSGRYTLSYAPKTRSGRLELKALAARMPELLPLLADYLPTAYAELNIEAGTAEGEARLDWRETGPGRKFAPSARLVLNDLVGGYQALRVRGAHLDLRLAGLDPLQAEGELSVGQLALPAGLALTRFQGRFGASGTRAAPVIEACGLAAETLGGRVRIDALHYAPEAAVRVPLILEDLDLAALLKLIAQEGLSGEGRISGTLPVLWEAGKLSLDAGARLNAGDAGVLRYRPPPTGDAKGEANIALQALSDFRYKRLNADLSYSPNGDYGMKLELEGSNPALYNGYPIAFNLKLEGHLPDLMQAALWSGDFSRHLLKSLKEQEKPAAKPGEPLAPEAVKRRQ